MLFQLYEEGTCPSLGCIGRFLPIGSTHGAARDYNLDTSCQQISIETIIRIVVDYQPKYG